MHHYLYPLGSSVCGGGDPPADLYNQILLSEVSLKKACECSAVSCFVASHLVNGAPLCGANKSWIAYLPKDKLTVTLGQL